MVDTKATVEADAPAVRKAVRRIPETETTKRVGAKAPTDKQEKARWDANHLDNDPKKYTAADDKVGKIDVDAQIDARVKAAKEGDWLALAKKAADMHGDVVEQLDKVPEHMRHAFSEMEKMLRYLQGQMERNQ